MSCDGQLTISTDCDQCFQLFYCVGGRSGLMRILETACRSARSSKSSRNDTSSYDKQVQSTMSATVDADPASVFLKTSEPTESSKCV